MSYAVEPDRLAARLPAALVPDTRAGEAYVSLVGVELVGVRVLGIRGLGVRRVPAVELHVPVRERAASPDRRGTIAVQAHVPRRLVAWGARVLYNEPVAVASMQPVWREGADEIEATYRFDWAGREQRVRVEGAKPPRTPVPDTRAAFLMNRGWRFGGDDETSLVRARLERAVAPVYRVREQHVTVRWGAVYGDEWAFLAGRDPACVFVSPGSPIALHWREPVS